MHETNNQHQGIFKQTHDLFLTAGPLGLLYCLFYPFFTIVATNQRGAADYMSTDSASVIIRIAYIFCVFSIAVYSIAKYNLPVFRYFGTGPLKYVGIYILLSFLSALWSPVPTYTLWMSFETIVWVLAFIVICSKFRDNLENISKFIITVGLIWLMAQLYQRFRNGGFSGFADCHGLGTFHTTPYLFFALLLPFVRKWIKAIIVVFAVLGSSAAVYISVLLIIPVIAFLHRSLKWKLIACTLSISIMVVFFVYLDGSMDRSMYVVFAGRESAMKDGNGRGVLYEEVWDAIKDKPIIGHGFATLNASLQDNYSELRVINYQMVHNIFLEASLYFGIVGFVLISLFFASFIVNAWKWRILSPVFLAIFITSLSIPVIAFFGNSFGGRPLALWFPHTFLSVFLVHSTFIERKCLLVKQSDLINVNR